jgi:hypothetical protein
MQLILGHNDQDYSPPTKAERSVQSARIINFKTEDYSFLRFYPNIKDLVIQNYRGYDFKPLVSLKRLEHLQIHTASKVNDWSPLSQLSRLAVIQLSSAPGNWLYGKNQLVSSFAPLARCSRLETLVLQGYAPRDGSLLSLAGLRKLKYLSVDGDYPVHQLAQFAAQHPDITCALLKPYRLIDGRCKKCKAGLYVLNGSDAETRRPVCPICHAGRLDAHITQWKDCQKKRR